MIWCRSLLLAMLLTLASVVAVFADDGSGCRYPGTLGYGSSELSAR